MSDIKVFVYHSVHHVMKLSPLVTLFHPHLLSIDTVISRKRHSILILIVDSGQAAGGSNFSVRSYRPSDFLSHFLLTYLVVAFVSIDLVVMKRLNFLLFLAVRVAVVAVESARVGGQRTSL